MKLLKRGMAGSLGLLMIALTLSGCGTSKAVQLQQVAVQQAKKLT